MMQAYEDNSSISTMLDGCLATIAEDTALLRGRLEGISDDRLAPLISELDRRFAELQEAFANVRRLAVKRLAESHGDLDAVLIAEIARQLELQFSALHSAYERLEQWILEIRSARGSEPRAPEE